MNREKLEHYRERLLQERNEHTQHVRDDQAAALEYSEDGGKDSLDMGLMDLNKELSFNLGERELQMVADIDQALLRMREGSYGICVRCGQLIDERRLDAMPWARYDANCQRVIERENGLKEPHSL